MKLILKNINNESIEISEYTDYVLTKVEGLGTFSTHINSDKLHNLEGEDYVGNKLESRNISIEFTILGKNKEDMIYKRSKLLKLLNPKLGQIILTYIDKGIERNVSAIAEHITLPYEENFDDIIQKTLIQLYCPNPFLKSPNLTVEPLAPFIEIFEFPSDYWELDEDGDLYFEVGFEGEKRELTVHGDVESSVQIKFYGPSTNPVIRNNTTGEFIKVNRTLTPEDILFIDTEDSIVTINSENVFNWIDINSTFWKLQVGANEIEYTADDGVADAKLEIIWNERYLGV